MADFRPTALQMCPFSDYLESGLRARLLLVPWFELGTTEQAEWLSARAGSVRAVITAGQIGCGSALMQALPALQMICVNGVGLDKVDTELARRRGIRVTTTPGLLADDVADLAVGLIIALLREIPAADAYVRAGHWPRGERPLTRQVTGRRFGIVGLGQIGAALAARLRAFGPVAYTGPRPKDVPYPFHADVLALARACDVLAITCPANAATHHLINAPVLAALGADGYLINVARGAVVDEGALVTALAAGALAGAALDVYENEPHVPAALRARDNVVLTPHMASATVETRRRMADVILAHLDRLATDGFG